MLTGIILEHPTYEDWSLFLEKIIHVELTQLVRNSYECMD